MALAYLLCPTFQIENTAGKPATGGYLEVYIAGSRNKYYCASDFNGTLHPFRIELDSLGSNIVLADDSNAYDVYVYNRYGSLLMSRYNVRPGAGGGGVSGDSITSSDGSIIVTSTADGVDLKVDAKPPTVMRCTAADLAGDGAFQFSELQRDGTSARVDSYAVKIDEGWWHYDATVRLRWQGEINGTQSVSLYTANGSDSLTFDLSYPHSETVHVSGEQKATQDGTAFVLGVLGMPSGMSASMVDFGIHSIVGEGAGGKYTAGSGILIDEANRVISIDPEVVQEKLTPGEGISIDEEGVISVDSSAVQEIFPVTYDSTTFQEIRTALTAGKLPVLFLGDGADVAVTVQRIPIHDFFNVAGSPGSSYAQFWSPYVYTSSHPSLPPYALFTVYSASYDFETQATTWRTSYKYFAEQPDFAESDATKLTFIKNKPDLSTYATQTDLTDGLATKQDVISDLSDIRAGAALGATAVQDQDYVHTDNNFTDADVTKLSGIEAGAEVNVQADWSESDSTSDSFVRNKPTIPSGSQLVPPATSSDAGEVLTVDQNGVPEWAPAQAPISAGDGIDITNNVVSAKVDGTSVTFNANGELEATAAPQVQSDWAEDDPVEVSFIRNKPGQTSLVAGANISIVYDAQNNTVTISAATVNVPVQDVTVDNVSVVNAQGVAEVPSIPVIGTVTL
jgi:hypothetical protein